MLEGQIKEFFVQHSVPVAAIWSSLIGVGSEITGLTQTSNTALFIALCGFAGAFFASLPKIISARATAKLSLDQFQEVQMQSLLASHKEKADRNEIILALQKEFSHTILGGYQAACSHITLLEMMLNDKGVTAIPKINFLDTTLLYKDLDHAIVGIIQKK